MSIRKHKGKIALSIAAAFWAACDSGSSSEPTFEASEEPFREGDNQVIGNQAIALYGVPSYDMSSSSITGNCAEGTNCAESSSSADNEYPNILATDPSVHCKDSTVYYRIYQCIKAAKRAAPILSDAAAPVYGVPNTPICDYSMPQAINSFVCTDGNIYSPPRYTEKDGVVYEDTTITEEQKNIQQITWTP